MCVIFVCDVERVSKEMLELGKAQNPHATGIAWRGPSPDNPNDVSVHWKKGNDIPLDEVIELAATLPLPYVIHFRNPSGGTGAGDGCAHPFPIDPRVPLYLNGNTPGFVLFHNGMWTGWKNHILEAAIRSRLKVPTDSWSDSRGLAWMAANFGHGVLELIDEKAVAFGPDKIEVYGITRDWKRVNKVLCSNDYWKKSETSAALPQHYRSQGHGHYPGHAGGNVHGPFAGRESNRSSSSNSSETTSGGRSDATTGGSSHQTPFRGAGGASSAAGSAEGGSKQDLEEEVQQGRAGSREEGGTEPSRWARGINSKQFRRGSTADRAKCDGKCGKKNAFINQGGKMFCHDCWMDEFGFNAKEIDTSSLYLTSKCETCRRRNADKITIGTKEWICGTCWHEARRPEVRSIMKSGDATLDKKNLDRALSAETQVVM